VIRTLAQDVIPGVRISNIMREHLILYKNMIINHMGSGPICFKSIARGAHRQFKPSFLAARVFLLIVHDFG